MVQQKVIKIVINEPKSGYLAITHIEAHVQENSLIREHIAT